ncbi:hypothetical protein [Oceanobacillus sp. Castelsardo]|uniref:hypothetical protein n=1 Tax=Oceanobacillus sp. Castelsardo TaxID=1851204 RepID=UPI0008384351|nr:hypothetical protein [Oceanobacillus sp. Castelsardo]
MEHPLIERTIRTGFPIYSPRREEYGIDALGNEVFCGDEILVYEDEFFLVETLMNETKEALEAIGATYEFAK